MKLLLVDGSTIFRMGLRASFTGREAGDLSVVGECGDATTACTLAESLAPDVVITELHLPDRNGMALARDLQRLAPGTRLLVMAAHAPEAIVHQAIGAGVSGYVLKSLPPDELRAAVRVVGRGELVLPAGIAALPPRPVGRIGRNRTVVHAIERLSQREREIFDLVVWGASNKQIAGRLGISIKTVETHRGHINGKLRVHTSADIVRLASLWGMIAPPSSAPDGVAARALPQ